MVEAYRDACALPRGEYLRLTAAEPLGGYKRAVDSRLNGPDLGRFTDVESYRDVDFARGVSLALERAGALLGGAAPGAHPDLPPDLAAACDDVDLAALLERQQELWEREGEVAVVCTGLFFLSLWPKALNRAWRQCRSLRML